MAAIEVAGKPIRLTATGVVSAVPGNITGVFVASGTPTIKLWDNASAGSGTVYVNTFQTAAATFYNLGSGRCNNGAFATITGTADVTFFYAAADRF